MARRRRVAITFTISFLDVMCCAFGVMVLLFLVIKHNPLTYAAAATSTSSRPMSEVKLLQQEILEGQENLARLRNSLAALDERVVTMQGQANRVTDAIKETNASIESTAAGQQSTKVEDLKNTLKKLDEERRKLEENVTKTGTDARSFSGEGNREYLTGLKLGGQHILILLDASASMLDKTIVNIIRRRNMSDDHKRSAKKWQQSIKTVDWLTAKLPPGSQYQIYTFNTATQPLLENTRGQWLNVSDREQLNQAVAQLKKLVPQDGTNMEQLFTEVGRLRPLPDNIYLITDGLPTQGDRPPRATTISSRDRQALFADALKKLPRNVPVNTILEPMEGDPMAASEFWKLAIATSGSFMSPSEDWP